MTSDVGGRIADGWMAMTRLARVWFWEVDRGARFGELGRCKLHRTLALVVLTRNRVARWLDLVARAACSLLRAELRNKDVGATISIADHS